jgi:hypothetical protein
MEIVNVASLDKFISGGGHTIKPASTNRGPIPRPKNPYLTLAYIYATHLTSHVTHLVATEAPPPPPLPSVRGRAEAPISLSWTTRLSLSAPSLYAAARAPPSLLPLSTASLSRGCGGAVRKVTVAGGVWAAVARCAGLCCRATAVEAARQIQCTQRRWRPDQVHVTVVEAGLIRRRTARSG